MTKNQLYVSAILVAMLFCGVRGACPSADLTGDCFVDFEDLAVLASQWQADKFDGLAVLASQWLTTGIPIPEDIVLIPAGTFQMGDSFNEGWGAELPVHTVQLDSFYIGKFEVTNGQYCDYLNSVIAQGLIEVRSGVVYAAPGGNDPYCSSHSADMDSQIDYSDGVFSVRTKGGRNMANDPMVMVSWYGTASYCNWRSQQEGKEQCYNLSTWTCDFNKHGYRLATEAEWEYAARGGLSGRRFPWGDTISHTQANYYSKSEYFYDVSPTRGYHPTWSSDGIYPYTSSVGSFAASGFGLYDMAGNVEEWCNDWFAVGYYSSSPYYNPPGPTSGFSRVIRGGCWTLLAGYSRVACRGDYSPGYRYYGLGFRCVLNLN